VTSLRTSFRLKQTGEFLEKLKGTATAVTFVGGKVTPLALAGLAVHALGVVIGLLHKDLPSVAARWHRVQLDDELHRIARNALLPFIVQQADEWSHFEIDGQAVLVNMCVEHYNGAFFAERDPVAALTFIRDQIWRAYGRRMTLLPSGRWGDSVALRPTSPADSQDSSRARQIWARMGPFLERGRPRSALLNGAPGGGKSTIVRRLLENADALGQPLRVLRVGVADFDYLRPSVVEAVVRLLLPDGIVIDDFDRLGNADKLLDFLEVARSTTRLILATSNDSAQLSAAVRRPKRFDVVAQVEGVGDELAARLLGERWAELDDAQRAKLATWPAVYVEELAGLLEVLPDLVVADEIAELQTRVDPPPAKLIAIEAAPAAGAIT
jgi:hypothetical protein